MIEEYKIYTGTTAPAVVSEKVRGRRKKFIPYNVTENNGVYTWEYIEMNASDYTYGDLINILIGRKYNLRETLAVLSNYMAEPKNPKYKAEFEAFQKCRKEAKEFAKSIFTKEE